MVQRHEERLLELYEKGVLTKEETRACFKDLHGGQELFLGEERSKLSFTLPNLRIFSSSQHKQEYSFEGIDSLFLSLSDGKVSLTKSKSDKLQVMIAYSQEGCPDYFPQVYVENRSLYFTSPLACQLTIRLPEAGMSVLDIDIGRADARLDYLPFEDISIHSKTDKKQQDIRLVPASSSSQHLYVQLHQAPLSLSLSKKQGVQARVESRAGQVMVNKKKRVSPYVFEQSGQETLYIKAELEQGQLVLKGVKHAV